MKRLCTVALQPVSSTGATLIELLVAILLVALLTGITAPAFRQRVSEPPPSDPSVRVRDARELAIASGKSQSIAVEIAGKTVQVTALPDGEVVGGELLGFSRVSGRPTSKTGP